MDYIKKICLISKKSIIVLMILPTMLIAVYKGDVKAKITFFLMLAICGFFLVYYKKNMYICLTSLIIGTILMGLLLFANTLLEFQFWEKNCVYSTDTVWNGDLEHCEALLYTMIKDSKCDVAPDCWIKKYVEVFAKETVINESVVGTIERSDIPNVDDFELIGRHWLRIYSLLISDEMNTLNQQDEELLRFYIDYSSITGTNDYLIFNDTSGGVYVQGK